jgi:hypothetical protein
MSFGNAFLDRITAGGLRRSMNARRLFPVGNAHCALMFGPLLIENGMTMQGQTTRLIQPIWALIYTVILAVH